MYKKNEKCMARLYKIMAIICLSNVGLCSAVDLALTETAIINRTTDYVNAYNEHNPEKLASFWAPNATYSNLNTREMLQGMDEITTYFKDQLTPDSKLNINIKDIIFTNDNTAVEKGTATVNSHDNIEKKSAFLAEWNFVNGSWKLQKVLEIENERPPSHYEQLKNLDWLIGKWKGNNEYADFSLNIDWDENRNFLFQNFILTVLGQKNLEAKQIIGWDPAKKQIRSWIFDTDGGFGEGFWNNEGDNWYIGMSYTLPDGRKASATHIYKKINHNTFTFASVDRDINGKILPDVKPFTLNKVQ